MASDDSSSSDLYSPSNFRTKGEEFVEAVKDDCYKLLTEHFDYNARMVAIDNRYNFGIDMQEEQLLYIMRPIKGMDAFLDECEMTFNKMMSDMKASKDTSYGVTIGKRIDILNALRERERTAFHSEQQVLAINEMHFQNLEDIKIASNKRKQEYERSNQTQMVELQELLNTFIQEQEEARLECEQSQDPDLGLAMFNEKVEELRNTLDTRSSEIREKYEERFSQEDQHLQDELAQEKLQYKQWIKVYQQGLSEEVKTIPGLRMCLDELGITFRRNFYVATADKDETNFDKTSKQLENLMRLTKREQDIILNKRFMDKLGADFHQTMEEIEYMQYLKLTGKARQPKIQPPAQHEPPAQNPQHFEPIGEARTTEPQHGNDEETRQSGMQKLAALTTYSQTTNETETTEDRGENGDAERQILTLARQVNNKLKRDTHNARQLWAEQQLREIAQSLAKGNTHEQVTLQIGHQKGLPNISKLKEDENREEDHKEHGNQRAIETHDEMLEILESESAEQHQPENQQRELESLRELERLMRLPNRRRENESSRDIERHQARRDSQARYQRYQREQREKGQREIEKQRKKAEQRQIDETRREDQRRQAKREGESRQARREAERRNARMETERRAECRRQSERNQEAERRQARREAERREHADRQAERNREENRRQADREAERNREENRRQAERETQRNQEENRRPQEQRRNQDDRDARWERVTQEYRRKYM